MVVNDSLYLVAGPDGADTNATTANFVTEITEVIEWKYMFTFMMERLRKAVRRRKDQEHLPLVKQALKEKENQ